MSVFNRGVGSSLSVPELVCVESKTNKWWFVAATFVLYVSLSFCEDDAMREVCLLENDFSALSTYSIPLFLDLHVL